MLICEKCKIEHSGDYGSGRFCSVKCAHSRLISENQKTEMKLRNKGKKYINGILTDVEKKHNVCGVCGEEIKVGKGRFCDNCREKSRSVNLSKSLKGRSGGYREGSGRSKFGYYKGIFCGSTYELAWVIYNMDHDITFQRFNGHIPYNGTKYFPDFIIDNMIIEIKGKDFSNTMPDKIEASKNAGYDIKILYKNDLKICFEWVKNHYNYRNVFELYDKYKPKYKYVCEYCSNTYYTDKKKKSNISYCSQKCAGYGVRALLNNRIDLIV